MPDMEQGFDLEKLKTDPQMWKRLAMQKRDGNILENVFEDKDNPFDKNAIGAMETVKRLAAEGKLYLRETGRSRHFHKVEKDGDNLKLGAQHEMRLATRGSDPVQGVLLWLSRGYFNWLGIGFLANWYDRRLKRRAERNEIDSRYKQEYKSLSKEEKKKLKALKKHEKNLKKLEDAKKEAEKTQQELDKFQGTDTTATKGEMNNPLEQPPNPEADKNTMQPTLTGDQPIRDKKPEQTVQNHNLVQEQTISQEITGNRKEKTEDNPNPEKTTLNQTESKKDDLQALLEEVRSGLQMIQQFVKQQKEIELNIQQRNQNQPTVTIDNKKLQELTVDTAVLEQILQNPQQADNAEVTQEQLTENDQPKPEENVQKEGVLIDLNEFQPNTVQQEVPAQTVDPAVLEQIFQQPQATEAGKQEAPVQTIETAVQEEIIQPPQATETTEAIQEEMPAIFNQGVKLEPEKVGIQERPKEQEPATLQERLAAEKQRMDAIKNWREALTGSLFSHPEGKAMADHLRETREDRAYHDTALSCVAFGVITKNTGTPESRQQVMDALLTGKPLGSQYNDLINEGVAAYNHAAEQMNAGIYEPMEKMLADAVRALNQQSSQETSLSANHVMISRLISNAFKFATEQNLNPPLSDQELQHALGSIELGKVSKNYHAARQHFGQGPVDITNPESRAAMCDLLAGCFASRALKEDINNGVNIPKTHIVMGSGTWSVGNMRQMISASKTMTVLAPDHVQAILEKPDGFRAACVSKDIASEVLAETVDTMRNRARNAEKQNVHEMEQQNVNQMQVPG